MDKEREYKDSAPITPEGASAARQDTPAALQSACAPQQGTAPMTRQGTPEPQPQNQQQQWQQQQWQQPVYAAQNQPSQGQPAQSQPLQGQPQYGQPAPGASGQLSEPPGHPRRSLPLVRHGSVPGHRRDHCPDLLAAGSERQHPGNLPEITLRNGRNRCRIEETSRGRTQYGIHL